MKSPLMRSNLIIHLLSVCHPIVVWGMALLGWRDDILLSLLTITMIVLLCKVYELPDDIISYMALGGCLLGFYIGTQGSQFLGYIFDISPLALNAISTFVITETLGWTIFLIVNRKQKNRCL